jgi:TusA-related sulfurtransferase
MAKRRMESLGAGQTLVVLATDPEGWVEFSVVKASAG